MGSMFGGLFGCVVSLVMIALVIYPMWRIFEKVGYPGFASLILLVPVVNLIALWYAALNPMPFELRLRGGAAVPPYMPPPPPPIQP
jgi:hypothetical protein